jgi:hypothetical protein
MQNSEFTEDSQHFDYESIHALKTRCDVLDFNL